MHRIFAHVHVHLAACTGFFGLVHVHGMRYTHMECAIHASNALVYFPTFTPYIFTQETEALIAVRNAVVARTV